MRLWLDCEFNSYKGDLISLALVDEHMYGFYAVLPCPDPHPWVAENVIPVLRMEPMPLETFQRRLEEYLMRYDSIEVIADWPEDIAHFCNVLITGPGTRINTPPLTMKVYRFDAPSELPHNAMYDAVGIREHFLKLEAAGEL